METVHRARWDDIDPAVLHDLVKLRVDVFVVEQACAYPEFDGRDRGRDTEHLWTADEDGVTSYIRTFGDGDALRIGRVCTRPDARGRGLSARLIAAALAAAPDRPAVLGAQSHLAGWYARFGFTVSGAEYVEDGIPHVPMRRPA